MKTKTLAMTISVAKMARTLLSFILSTSLVIFLISAPVSANSNIGIESQISVGFGMEMLEYKEHEKDTGTESEAKLHNLVFGIEGLKRWKYFFCGVRSVFPILLGDGQEEVTHSEKSFQKDTLELRWIRIDGFLGYSLRNWINPYLGIRWSEVRQERTNFIVAGNPVELQSVEEVKSWSLLLGIRGVGNFTPRMKWNYGMEYFLPLAVEVTNTALPGFKASDRDGHMLELKGGFDYSYTNSICFGLLFYGGWMHWSGSEWKSFGNSLVKWPENDTFYLGGGLKVTYKF